MNWLDLGDLDLIFKVTAVEKLKIHSLGHLFSLKTPLLVCTLIHQFKMIHLYLFVCTRNEFSLSPLTKLSALIHSTITP